jgi:hypothetical protein
VIWSEGWSKESEIKVATAELEPILQILDKNKDQMIQGAVYLHNQAASAFKESPASFMNFI